MAFSTGVSLLTAGGGILRNKIAAWSEMDSSTNYVNAVTGNTFISGVSGLQSTTSPVSAALGSFHTRSFGSGAGVFEHTVSESDISFLRLLPHSIGFWVKRNATGGNSGDNVALLFGRKVPSGSTNYGLLTYGIANYLEGLAIYNANGEGELYTGFLAANSWHFVVLTRNAVGTVSFYVNNVLVGTLTGVSSFIDSSGNTKFCTKYYESFSGVNLTVSMDSLFIAAGEITPDERSYLYNSGSGRKFSDLPYY